jgi:hypothetical protein
MLNNEQEVVENKMGKNKMIFIFIGCAVLLLVIGLGLWYNNYKFGGVQNQIGSIPVPKDSDRDLLGDEDEKKYGTDSLKADTDQDGLEDGFEVSKGLNPNNPHSLSPTMLDAQALVVQNTNLLLPKSKTTTKQ